MNDIICRVCNKPFQRITNTHLDKDHNGMTMSEYNEKYNEIETEKLKLARIANMRKWIESAEGKLKRVEQGQLMKQKHDLKFKQTLDDVQKQVMYGSLLGDGCISFFDKRNKRNAHYEENHSFAQEDYIKWKAVIFEDLGVKFKTYTKYDTVGDRVKKDLLIISPSTTLYTNLWKMFYKDYKQKYINDSMLKELDILGLAVWYMDDGYYGDGRPLIYSYCFSKTDNIKLQKFLKQKFKIIFKVKKSTHGYNLQVISREEGRKFLELIKPFIHYNCIYKLGENFRYKDLTVTKIFNFMSAHKLEGYASGSKNTCGNPNYHGHFYVLEVKIKNSINPKTQMIIDYGDIKTIVNKKIIDRLDHANLNVDVPEIGYTTTENISFWIWKELIPVLPNLCSVKVWETDTSYTEIQK